jgi:NADH-quinone oxidoreductase subunit J
VFPFEITSALLITAALGAMVLAHRERLTPRLTQRDLSRLRVASGRPAPLPGPGTYARHNAVDMPALLPDGTPAPTSVSPFITQRIEPPRHDTARVLADQRRRVLGSDPGPGGDDARGAAEQEGDPT